MEDSGKNKGFTQADIKAVLESQAGRQLLQLLQKDGGKALRQAAQAVQNGDYTKAKTVLEPVMTRPEAAKLVEEINKGRG